MRYLLQEKLLVWFQKSVFSLSEHAILNQDIDTRTFATWTVPLNKEEYVKLKKEISDTLWKIFEKYDTKEKKEGLYLFNFNLIKTVKNLM